jgi:hypothetical protein
MTISIAWVRTVNTCEELIFASDSRLSGDGATIDYCPKIINLPRADCAIGFAGTTGRAYALIHQLTNAISAFGSLESRAMDIRELRTHAIKIFSTIVNSIDTPIKDLENPDVAFIFGGYSWILKSFVIWHISYDNNLLKMIARPAEHAITNPEAKKIFIGSTRTASLPSNTNLGKICFGGDQAEEARIRFINHMNNKFSKNPSLLENSKLDWEPFEVVCDMLKDPDKAHTIGGSPQVVKVYQHMNTMSLAIYWPDKSSGQIYLHGRPVFGYENIDNWIIDPETLRSSHLKHSGAKPA